MSGLTVLEPVTVGPARLRNRLVFPATVNNLGMNTSITERQIEFYRARARGGVGAIVTEGLSVHPTSIPNRSVPLVYLASLRPGLRALADAVHLEGSAVFGQLWHVGRNALWGAAGRSWSASPLPDPLSGIHPHVMDPGEIEEVIEGYATSAVNLAEAGFDGVEVHAAHGYLLTQFLSPWSNQRTDEWGGDAAGRARILRRIMAEIRNRCGRDFVIGLKLSVDEHVPGGLDVPGTLAILAQLGDDAPPDFVAASQGNFSTSLETHVPDSYFVPGLGRGLARSLREALGPQVSVMAVGRVPDVAFAEELVSGGSADLVAMGRALIADPDAVAKVRAGGRPRPCVFCNACWHEIHSGRPVECFHAPSEPEKAAEPPQRRTIAVVGAGPSGIEYGRVATANGHRVTVYERLDHPGGRLALDGLLPGRSGMAEVVRWMVDDAVRSGCSFVFGAPMSARELDDLPDGTEVVIASGSEIVLPGFGDTPSISLDDAIRRPRDLSFPAVIIDEARDEPVYAAAVFLSRFGQVAVVTPAEAIAQHVAYVSRIGIHRRLQSAGVVVHALSTVARRSDGPPEVVSTITGERIPGPDIASVIVAGGYRPARPEPLRRSRRVTVIGDAYARRSVAAVIAEARAVAIGADARG